MWSAHTPLASRVNLDAHFTRMLLQSFLLIILTDHIFFIVIDRGYLLA